MYYFIGMKSSQSSNPKKNLASGSDSSAFPIPQAYQIILTIKDDAPDLGTLRGKNILLNNRGRVIANCWREFQAIHPGIQTDAITVNLRQLHGILFLSTLEPKTPILSDAIKLFKVLSALRLSQLDKKKQMPDLKPTDHPNKTSGLKAIRGGLWKKSFIEKSIQAKDLEAVRKSLGT